MQFQCIDLGVTGTPPTDGLWRGLDRYDTRPIRFEPSDDAPQKVADIRRLTAAAALLVDYVLTVSVSVAAGVEALTSAAQGTDFAWLAGHRAALCVGLIALVALANLRGNPKQFKGDASVFRGFSLAGPAANPKLAAVWHAQIKIWSLDTFQEDPIKIHARAISSGVLRPDGGVIALADGSVRIWDTQTDQEIPAIPSLSGTAVVAFSPDGSQLASAAGSTIQLQKLELPKAKN